MVIKRLTHTSTLHNLSCWSTFVLASQALDSEPTESRGDGSPNHSPPTRDQGNAGHLQQAEIVIPEKVPCSHMRQDAGDEMSRRCIQTYLHHRSCRLRNEPLCAILRLNKIQKELIEIATHSCRIWTLQRHALCSGDESSGPHDVCPIYEDEYPRWRCLITDSLSIGFEDEQYHLREIRGGLFGPFASGLPAHEYDNRYTDL